MTSYRCNPHRILKVEWAIDAKELLLF